MLTETETTKLLKETGALLEGHFILSSGLRSEKYVQYLYKKLQRNNS